MRRTADLAVFPEMFPVSEIPGIEKRHVTVGDKVKRFRSLSRKDGETAREWKATPSSAGKLSGHRNQK